MKDKHVTPASLERMFRSKEYQAMLTKAREDLEKSGERHLQWWVRRLEERKP